MTRNKGQTVMQNTKKKQVKDELDLLKQAEKKKRRLEKALATSAAIISELEKKKQKKKEEQQRLDEEGAAIAEAVALHVLLDEDADDACEVVVNKGSCNVNVDLIMASRRVCFPVLDDTPYLCKEMGWVLEAAYQSREHGRWTFSSPAEKDFYAPFYEEPGWETADISAELIAVQAVSSLHIAENGHDDRIVLNRMLRHKP